LTQQEPVDEGVQLPLLAARESTVIVISDLGKTHGVGDAQSLLDLLSGLHASVARLVGTYIHHTPYELSIGKMVSVI